MKSAAEALAASFRALGHPDRLTIVRMLQRQALACCAAERVAECTLDPASCNVGAIVRRLGVPAPTVSHHLKELVAAGLVERARSGRHIHCRINPDRLRQLRHALDGETAASRKRKASE